MVNREKMIEFLKQHKICFKIKDDYVLVKLKKNIGGEFIRKLKKGKEIALIPISEYWNYYFNGSKYFFICFHGDKEEMSYLKKY